jgi:hypothetical protein
MNELDLHKATRGTCHVLASLSFSLKFTKIVAQAQRQKAKIPRATKEFNREYLQMLRWHALSKGLVLRAFGIRGRRGRRPMICFLAFLRYGEGQRAAQLPAGSFDTGEGQRACPPRRDAGSLKWSIMRGRRPWSLVRAALTHVFAIVRPAGSSATCQRPRDHG